MMGNLNRKPKCVIVTGRAGAGKTTVAKKLGERLWMPVISRDEIKEGYVNTFGVKHDRLPTDTDALVSDFFFAVVNQFLANKISVVIEAAFQHKVWEFRMPDILELASPMIVLCSVEDIVAAKRHLQRGLDNPHREFFHSDNRVVHYRKTGEFLLPAEYEEPELNVPTIKVSTNGEYVPSLDEIVKQIESNVSESDLNSQTFYHGTKADLKPGDLIEAGFSSNYGQKKKAKYIYLTATLDAAVWGAELALGEGRERIYIVEPTGEFEDDPNLTDKKFPGNPTKSYRSLHPLRVISETTDWQGHSPEQLKAMKDHLEKLKELGIEAIED